MAVDQPNAIVTFADVDTILPIKTAWSGTYTANRTVWKSALQTYWYSNSVPLASYADNQLIQYQDVQPLPNVDVSIYAKKSTSSGTATYVWYSLDGSTWNKLTTAVGTGCTYIGVIPGVTSGHTVYFSGQTTDGSTSYGTGGIVGSSCGATFPTTCSIYSVVVSPGVADTISLSINKAISC